MEIDNDEYWLINDMSIECWESEHLAFMNFVAIPALLIYGLTVPIIALVFIYRNRNLFYDEDTRLKYAYLYLGFKPECYYWEFVIQARKVVFAVIVVFLSGSSNLIVGYAAYITLIL
jgi:hypothetical protein